MEKTVEFKIRIPQADRWEDTPVYRSKTLTGTKEEIAQEAQEIAEGIGFSQSSDVRWNYEGDTQGHYVDEIFPDLPYVIRDVRLLLLPYPDQAEATAN